MLQLLCYALDMKRPAYVHQLGISYDTAWRRWQRGELAGRQLPPGTISVDAPARLLLAYGRWWSRNVALGVNDQCPWFLAVLAYTSISHIVVEQKSRCSRFGVVASHTLLKMQGQDLVLGEEAELEPMHGQENVLQNVIVIIPSFTVHLYRHRRASRKHSHWFAAVKVEVDGCA
jgi:putative resolvase